MFVVDHDDSPNSPPSAVSSQGSSVDISLAREVSFIHSLYNNILSDILCYIGSRALSFSDPYIHFACLSVLLSVRNFGAKYLGNEAR